jgi:NADH-quinone oxidoreductase subunit E
MHMLANSDDTIDLALMEPILNKYSGQKGSLIPILQQVQGLYGYLPRPALDVISRRLRMPTSQIFGVATFYSQFYLERRGKHVLKVCDGTACHVKGTPALLSAVKSDYGLEPGQTTPDYSLSLEVVYCIGSCALAPVGVLDEEVVGNLKQDTLRQVVREKLTAADIPSEQ